MKHCAEVNCVVNHLDGVFGLCLIAVSKMLFV
jgi:hypothetical protein